MKRISRIICFVILLAAVIIAPIVLSDSFVTVSAKQTVENPFKEEQMRQLLKDYVGGADGTKRLDRTPFSVGEQESADYLKEYMDSLGFETSLEPVKYTVKVRSGGGWFSQGIETTEEYNSQNVVSVLRSDSKTAKPVIIGTNYDNQFSDFKTGAGTALKGTKGHGAYTNGTGVATLMAVSEYLSKAELPFDLYIVYFGAGEFYNYGADEFVEKNRALVGDAMFMVNLMHIGGDNVYVYCDEVRTDHEDYIFAKADEIDADLSKVPSTLPRMAAQYLDGIGYAHYAMLGATKAFADANVPYANIFGGTFETMSLSLDETKGKKNVSYTENDNVAYLEKNMPRYAEKMADTANALCSVISAPDFVASVENSRNTKYNYSVLMQRWIPSVIVIGVVLACGLLLIPIARHFEKKYPYKPQYKRLKVAVFGMDYEEPSDGDVFIDVKPKDNNKNPFDGY